jgi:hypothetical protein
MGIRTSVQNFEYCVMKNPLGFRNVSRYLVQSIIQLGQLLNITSVKFPITIGDVMNRYTVFPDLMTRMFFTQNIPISFSSDDFVFSS